MANGQLQETHYFDNTGGTNLSDSVFRIAENQAAGGFNFNCLVTGGIQKRLGPLTINSSPDVQLRSLGFGLYNTTSGVKSVIRAAGTKIQHFDPDVPDFTNLSEDTLAATTDFFTSGSTQTVSASQFNNGSSEVLWLAGGGMDLPRGATSLTKVTKNGVNIATGTVTATPSASGLGDWPGPGTYVYVVVLRKASTQALSNAALDVSATTTNDTDTVSINLSGITGLDTTLVDQIWIYRSAVSGIRGFTSGDLIAQIPSTQTSFIDKGPNGNPDILSNQSIPRAGNVVLDNSVLPAGTYNAMTVFKRRLVVASGSTLQISDLNKSESWPLTNPITVPSGGNITALAVISFTSPQAQTLDEIMVVYKEREMWVITGNDYTDVSLKFIDQVGCIDQSLVVLANGFLSWIDFRGIYLWDGTSKPIYCSRLLEPLFARDGDLDKTKLSFGHGEFFRKENTIIWYVSSKTYGENKFAIKMDLRLTLPKIEQQLTGRNLDAVLIPDTYQFPVYASLSYIPSGGSDEMMVLGDDAGYCYFASDAYADGMAGGVSFTYLTKPLDQGMPNVNKLYYAVIAWVANIGNWDLTLDYWSDFRTSVLHRASKALPISDDQQSSGALWDLAYWDIALWDDATPSPQIKPILFMLEPGPMNNNQGSALQVQFRNTNSNEPLTIHGFSVLWSPLGGILERTA